MIVKIQATVIRQATEMHKKHFIVVFRIKFSLFIQSGKDEL